MYDGVHVDSIHSEQSHAARSAAVDNFRLGRTWVLIATDLIGRGMDFIGVKTVINYDFPNSTADYVHRVGRTGRAGQTGMRLRMMGLCASLWAQEMAQALGCACLGGQSECGGRPPRLCLFRCWPCCCTATAGEAVTFFTEDDAGQLRSIANIVKEAGGEVPDWMTQLSKGKDKKKRVKLPASVGASLSHAYSMSHAACAWACCQASASLFALITTW